MNRRTFLSLFPVTVGAVAVAKPVVKQEVIAPLVHDHIEGYDEVYDQIDVTCFGDTESRYIIGGVKR